jgi:hypothetical protein
MGLIGERWTAFPTFADDASNIRFGLSMDGRAVTIVLGL